MGSYDEQHTQNCHLRSWLRRCAYCTAVAKELNYNEADVTLVNKHDYHYITTHLHMPAAGTDNPENARVSISKLIDEFKIDFVKSTVVQIRPQDKRLFLRMEHYRMII